MEKDDEEEVWWRLCWAKKVEEMNKVVGGGKWGGQDDRVAKP